MITKEILLSTFKSKVGFCFSYKDLKEVEILIDMLVSSEKEIKTMKEKIENGDKFRKIMYKQAIPLSKITFEQIDNMPQYWDLFNENKELKDSNKTYERYIGEANHTLALNEFEINSLLSYIKDVRNFVNGNSYGKISRKMNELDVKYNINRGK